MYRRIQNLKKKGYGKAAISKRLRIDPATVRKYYYMEPKEYTRYLKMTLERPKIFQNYEDEILDVYKINLNRRLNMSAVFDYLEERFTNLPGSEKSLRNYIHYLEKTRKLIYAPEIRLYEKVPELPYGKQMQLDFGEHKSTNGIKLYIFGVVLSASRFKYVALQEKPFKTMDVILHLLDCFDYFGGIPQELVIDQDSLMVVNENHGEIVYTQKFKTFLEEIDLKMYVCRKADPESKGKVENLIKYVKYNFLQVRCFNDIEEARESLRKWLVRRANGKICQSTRKIPSIAIEQERSFLRPVKNSIFRKESFLSRDKRIVSDKSFITYGSNDYSVPAGYRKNSVEIYSTEEELFIFDDKTGEQIATHKLSLKTGIKVTKKKHFRCNSKPIKDLIGEVTALHHFEGWKEFFGKNQQTYPRYVRDQCILARRLFSNVGDKGLFETAVNYCLSNKTYGMTALRDTYSHCKKEHKEDQEMIHKVFGTVLGLRNIKEPDVSHRSIGAYEAIIESAKQGGDK